MAIEEEPIRPLRPAIEVGSDISALSEAEIEEHIAALEAEIERLRTALAAKQASRAAADAFFRK